MSVDAPVDPNKDLATTAEWRRLNIFLDGLAERGRATGTVRAYEDDWRSLASWYRASFGRPFDLPQLVGMDTADYFAYLQRTHAPATAARRLVFLKRYVASANRAGEASAELRERVEGLRPPRKQREAPRGLTPEEARAALRRVQQEGSERDRAIVFTFLHTGLRVSELAGLDRRDVDINERSG
jgi:integrase/recombinase XerD